jgi:L-cysteine:1D-myo-inositol 2-amino-2-deoxy-alpha-D-glucopyranoside ligase
MVRHGGEKMSKSLGNLVWARDLLKEHSADALRLYLAAHHYAIEWSHDPGMLDWAGTVARRLAEAVTTAGGAGEIFSGADWKARFDLALETDLDTPRAVGIIDDLGVRILVGAARGENVRPAQDCLRELAGVLGVQLARDNEHPTEAAWSVHLSSFKSE